MSEYRPSIEECPSKDMIVGEATVVRDEQIPPEYMLFQREIRLLNGNTEPAFYSTHPSNSPDPDAWEKVAPSIMEGFIWALTVEEFDDHETEDDDRTQEIGNMMSYALSQGLTEPQVMECYEQAYVVAQESDLLQP